MAGIAIFLLGIKFLSGGLQSGAGKTVKKTLARIGDNRFVGVGVGATATVAIQSSTAVTVMVVGFVNAGVMTLHQAAAVIMGANIGTTATAFMGALGSLPIASFFMFSGIIGIVLYMFGKKERLKLVGKIILAFALLFVGMHLMSRALRGNAQIEGFFTNAFQTMATSPVGPLVLFLLGTLLTALLQSSTATTMMIVNMATAVSRTITIAYYPYYQVVIDPPLIALNAALPVILGANLGTCLTALIASVGASPNAKRAALIHLSTDIFGFVVFLPILWIWGTPISEGLAFISGGNYGIAASFFHLFYNMAMIGILIWFIKPLIKLVTKLVPAREGELSTEPQLYFIDEKASVIPRQIPENVDSSDSLQSAVANSIFQREDVFKEVVNMAGLAHENLDASLKCVISGGITAQEKNKIISTEQKINYINKGIGRHLIKFSNDAVFVEDQQTFNSLHHVIFDIERIGDHAMNFVEEAQEMKSNKIVFSEYAVKNLEDMFSTISDMLHLSLEILETRNSEKLDEISKFRRKINENKRAYGFEHISRLNKGECNVEAGVHFYAIMTGLERVKDHLTNIAYSVKSTAGTQHERLKKLSKERIKKRSEGKNVYW